MKIKRLFIILLVFIGVMFLTGCETKEKEKKEETTKILYTLSNTTIELSVPINEDGEEKYSFTKEKPEYATNSGAIYLVTDKSIFTFSEEGWTYQTSQKYKEKNGTKEGSYDEYRKWIEDKDSTIKLSGMEDIEINGRKAIRYYNQSGSSSNYKYHGYFYILSLDDIYNKSRLNMTVNYNKEEAPSKIEEFDKETLNIINSLKVKSNNTK